MKKGIYIILPVVVISMCLWVLKRKQPEPLKPGAEIPVVKPLPDRGSLNTFQSHSAQPLTSDDEVWMKEHSAGLKTEQKYDPESNEPRGTITARNLTIDLGETPPLYRHELQTSGCPILLGDKHQRRSFEIYAASLFIEPDGITKKYPLHITYPRWPGAGLETSGGFVFMRNENPLTKIGVIVPKVSTPEDMGPGAADLLEWQINIRMNDRLGDIDARTKAKPQSLGPDVVVLLPTHPDKIPASSFVVWFKFEKDGSVSLLE